MGLFDAGKFNCSKTGKFLNYGVSIGSLGMITGPSSKQCYDFSNPKPPTVDKVNYYDKIKNFVQENGLVIAVIIIALIYLKKK